MTCHWNFVIRATPAKLDAMTPNMQWDETRWCSFDIPTLRRQVGTLFKWDYWKVRCIYEVGSGNLLSLHSARSRHGQLQLLTSWSNTNLRLETTQRKTPDYSNMLPQCFGNRSWDDTTIRIFRKPGFPPPSARSTAFRGVQRAPGQVRHIVSIVCRAPTFHRDAVFPSAPPRDTK